MANLKDDLLKLLRVMISCMMVRMKQHVQIQDKNKQSIRMFLQSNVRFSPDYVRFLVQSMATISSFFILPCLEKPFHKTKWK